VEVVETNQEFDGTVASGVGVVESCFEGGRVPDTFAKGWTIFPGEFEGGRLETRWEEQWVTGLSGKREDKCLNDLGADDGEYIGSHIGTVGKEEVVQGTQVIGVDVVEGGGGIFVARGQEELDVDAL
jgi:hypothetical protein